MQFIDSKEDIALLTDWMVLQDILMGDSKPWLFIDLEGQSLSRHGSISLLTVLVYGADCVHCVYIIGIHLLQSAAFQTKGLYGKSLKDILESPGYVKVFFDVGRDSDALFAHYGIELKGVRDLQLMESATRPTTEARRYLSSLSDCVESLIKDAEERNSWTRHKDEGERLWSPLKGGSYEAFNIRPLPDKLMAYCAGNVQQLPALYLRYRIPTIRWNTLIARQSQSRVSESQGVIHPHPGADMARSPWSNEQNQLLDSWEEVRRHDFRGIDEKLDRHDGDYLNDYDDWTRAPWKGPLP